MTEKRDIKRERRDLYRPSARTVVEVELPEFSFLMSDGCGDPNGSAAYAEAVEALFAVSYTAKFALKKSELALDYAVMPLEGLWWADDWSVFQTNDRSAWHWTLMIRQPEFLPQALIEDALAQVAARKRQPGVAKLRLERFREGRCAQILHVGPFSEEGPTLERLHRYIDERSSRRGKHHEIYLSDIRRAAPRNWKTILRQPME